MRTLRLAMFLGLAVLQLAGACRTVGPAPDAAVGAAAASSKSAEKLAPPEQDAQKSTPLPDLVPPKSPPEQAPPTPAEKPKNRDPKGSPDVLHYIDQLESAGRVAELRIDLVLRKISPPTDADIGDLGCGPGLFAMAFAHACPEGVVYASDIEPAELDAVRAKIHAEHVRNVVPVLASPDDPHFPPGRLDVIFIGDTYHHLEDRVAYMQRLATTLKPGGRLVILDYKPGKLDAGPPPEHKLAAGVMEKELVEAGYVRVERFDTHPYHDFEIWRVVQPWEKK